jgi:hypothetical protein
MESLEAVAEANSCVPHMLQVLNAAVSSIDERKPPIGGILTHTEVG